MFYNPWNELPGKTLSLDVVFFDEELVANFTIVIGRPCDLTLPRLGGGQNDPQHYIFAYKNQTVYTEKFKLLEFS